MGQLSIFRISSCKTEQCLVSKTFGLALVWCVCWMWFGCAFDSRSLASTLACVSGQLCLLLIFWHSWLLQSIGQGSIGAPMWQFFRVPHPSWWSVAGFVHHMGRQGCTGHAHYSSPLRMCIQLTGVLFVGENPRYSLLAPLSNAPPQIAVIWGVQCYVCRC